MIEYQGRVTKTEPGPESGSVSASMFEVGGRFVRNNDLLVTISTPHGEFEVLGPHAMERAQWARVRVSEAGTKLVCWSTAIRRVILESPYAGDLERNQRYLQACLRHSLLCGESPVASHRLFTEALNDLVAEERILGISAGNAWREVADATVVYTDLGISPGMKDGIVDAERLSGHKIEYRSLGDLEY